MTDPTDRERMSEALWALRCDRAEAAGYERGLTEGRRAAFEEAAAKADAERDEYEALIAAGKGQWQRPGYVPDDMWTKFIAVAACSRRLGDAIRALAAKEQT